MTATHVSHTCYATYFIGFVYNIAQTSCVSLTEKASTDCFIAGYAGRWESAGGGVSDWVIR